MTKMIGMVGDNAGWITDRGEIELCDHWTGYENTEIHHVDISLAEFGDEVGYPGRDVSHYSTEDEDFWGYGMAANELAMGQGWVMWGNNPDLRPTSFFAIFQVKPSDAAIDATIRLVKRAGVEVYSIEWLHRKGAMRVDRKQALDYLYGLKAGIMEDIEDIRRRAGLCG